MLIKSLKSINKGEYFKRVSYTSDGELKITEKVYVRDYYEPSSKKYCCYLFDDVKRYYMLSGSTLVTTDFEF